MMHRHEWEAIQEGAVAKYSKRNTETDAIFVMGTLETCACGLARLQVPGLMPVEVETCQG